MEQLIYEIKQYEKRTGMAPQRLLRNALNAEWDRWDKWINGKSSPRIDTVEKVRAYIAAHPSPQSEASA